MEDMLHTESEATELPSLTCKMRKAEGKAKDKAPNEL